VREEEERHSRLFREEQQEATATTQREKKAAAATQREKEAARPARLQRPATPPHSQSPWDKVLWSPWPESPAASAALSRQSLALAKPTIIAIESDADG
jgi:hypothetical protein